MSIDVTKKITAVSFDGTNIPISPLCDSNITAGNIKDGVSILGVSGTFEGADFVWGIATKSLSGTITTSAPNIPKSMFLSFSLLQGINAPQCTSISESAFYDCTSLTNISFPLCTSIGNGAFSNCTSLTNISFPQCTFIDWGAFLGCTSLTNISFPLCTSIDGAVFSNCTSLTNISFPQCTSIGWGAFWGCYRLLSLTLANSVVCSMDTNVFTDTPIGGYTEKTGGVLGSVYVPASLVESYKVATNWVRYSDRITAIVE